MADQRATGAGPAGAPHETLLARFIERAAEMLGREPTETGATPPSPRAGTRPGPFGAFDKPGLKWIDFEDWSEYTQVDQVMGFTVENADDVVTLCNNARNQKATIRALGHSHNWSPLVLQSGQPKNVLLIDTSLLNSMTNEVVDGRLQATFGAGTTLEAATAYLESLDTGVSQPRGYSFLNMPTVGGLTLGGILAVGGHGTSVPFAAQQEPDLMGCLSNMIVSFKAIVTDPADPGSYTIKEFQRSDPDASAFLVHLGRAFITEVTLTAVPNYYLQLTNLFPHMDVVMAPATTKPLPPSALASLLDTYGRVEVIWFPYQPMAWVQCNTRFAATPPKEPSTWVTGPYNFGWMNIVPREASDYLRKKLADDPLLVPLAMATEISDAYFNMHGTVLNGTARDLEIYLTDNTLRMSAFGYVLQLHRSDVQAAANDFYVQLTTLLDSYRAKQEYPVNGAVEIRCTTIDQQAGLGIAGAKPPALAATHSVDANDPKLDTVLWVDVLTFPDAPGSAQFFVDLENWMIKSWAAGKSGRLRPEWSKGWAYTATGPWTNTDVINNWIPSVYNGATDGLTFDWARQTLAKYDNANIFSNPFLDTLFS